VEIYYFVFQKLSSACPEDMNIMYNVLSPKWHVTEKKANAKFSSWKDNLGKSLIFSVSQIKHRLSKNLYRMSSVPFLPNDLSQIQEMFLLVRCFWKNKFLSV
jgi:hypothetical protein